MESSTETPRTLRTLLEQFKPAMLDTRGKQIMSVPTTDNVVPTFLYRVGNASNITSPSSSPSMVVKSNSYALEDSTIRRTRTVIPYSVKCQITKLAEENPRITQGEIAQVFGIDRTTVSKILKRRKEFLDDSYTDDIAPPKAKASRYLNTTLNEKHEEEVYKWYKKLAEKNVVVTQTMILEAAETLAGNFGIPRLHFSKQWLNAFLDRYKMTCKDVFVTDTNEGVSTPGIDSKTLKNLILNYDLIQASNQESPPAASRLSKVQKGKVEMKPQTSPKSNSTVTDSQRLSQPKASASQSSGNKIPRERVLIPPTESQTDKEKEADEEINPRMHIKQEVDTPEEIDDQEALSREMGNLEKFREQQKMIEEANKQRKALLAKTLSERQKRARQEAAKLAHIQKELQLLDNRLTADVTVIRSRIELASREFLEAQKRYDRAEREFIEAKIDLQKKSEMKEQLTEHLYTIIHQNEVRKARKLSELMGELEMEAKEDGVQLPELPPLSSFATINAVQALQSPKSPTDILSSLHQQKKATELLDLAEPEKAHGGNEKNIDRTTDNDLCPVDLSSTEKNSTQEVLIPTPETSEPAEKTAESLTQECDSSKTSEDTSSTSNIEEAGTCISNTAKTANANADDRESTKETEQGVIDSSENTVTSKDVPSSWTLDVVEVKKEPPE